jgi:hypothetical protein
MTLPILRNTQIDCVSKSQRLHIAEVAHRITTEVESFTTKATLAVGFGSFVIFLISIFNYMLKL